MYCHFPHFRPKTITYHNTLNSHQAWTWLQKPQHSVLVGHYWSNGTGPGDKVYLQRLIQKECKLTEKESVHIHSFSEFINVCEIWGKTPLGSSNLFGSLTPLMVSVSGHLIKILKVKSQIHPVLIFMDEETASDLHPIKLRTQASCSYVHPPSHAAPALSICWTQHIFIVSIISSVCLHIDLYGLFTEIVLHENDSLVNQQIYQSVKF